jgi:hypothetical protein
MYFSRTKSRVWHDLRHSLSEEKRYPLNLYLDNSAVNWLLRHGHNDFQCAIQGKHLPIIGEYVVLEAGATPDADRRERLFNAINALGVKVVLCNPFDMAKSVVVAISKGEPIVDAMVRSKGALLLVTNPLLAKQEYVQKECATKLRQFDDFNTATLMAAAFFEQEYIQGRLAKLGWIDFLRNLFLYSEVPKWLIDAVLEATDLVPISVEEARDLITKVPILTYWFVCILRFMYEAFRVAGSNNRPTQGVFIDIMQGIVLSQCDIFVSKDKHQIAFLLEVISGVYSLTGLKEIEEKSVVDVEDISSGA